MKKQSFLLLSALLFGACGTNPTSLVSEESVSETYFPLEQCVPVTDIEPYVRQVEIVPLETTPASVIGEVSKFLLREDGAFVVLSHSGVFVFGPDGKFLFPVGRIGRGPGEYTKLNDICLTRDGESILALSAFNDILQYRVEDGSYVKTIRPEPKLEYSCDGIAPGPDNGFYLYAANPSNADDFEMPFNCLILCDQTGKIVSQGLPRLDFGLQVAMITQSADNSYILRPQEGDNVAYHIDTTGRLAPWIRIDFQDKAIPTGFVRLQGGSAWEHLQTFLRSDYYKLPIHLQQTSEGFYFACAGPDAQTHEFLYFGSSGRGIRWTGDASSTPFVIGGSDDSWFYGVYDDMQTYGADELLALAPVKRYLVQCRNLKLTEDHNPVVVKIQFKER